MEADTTERLRRELDQARDDFRRTAFEIKRRFEADQVRLESEVRENPMRSLLIAGALGFVLGRASRHSAILLALLTGAAVGYSIACADRVEKPAAEYDASAKRIAG
jgi:hypothetical protein